MIISDEGYAVAMGNIYISSEQIIQEVQKFQCLYDPGHPDHKDRDVMRDAWQSVTAAVVGEPWDCLNSAEKNEAVKEVQRRWKNIRDSLRKSLNCSGKTPRKPYLFLNKLTFLLDVIDIDKNVLEKDDTAVAHGSDGLSNTSSSNFVRILRPKRKSTVIDYLDDDTSGTPDADELSETSDSLPATRSPRPKRKKHKPRQIQKSSQRDSSFEREQSVRVPHKARNSEDKSPPYANCPCSRNALEPENPDRMFLLSLLPRVSALGSRNKLDFQIKAMQMLRGYSKDETVRTTPVLSKDSSPTPIILSVKSVL